MEMNSIDRVRSGFLPSRVRYAQADISIDTKDYAYVHIYIYTHIIVALYEYSTTYIYPSTLSPINPEPTYAGPIGIGLMLVQPRFLSPLALDWIERGDKVGFLMAPWTSP